MRRSVPSHRAFRGFWRGFRGTVASAALAAILPSVVHAAAENRVVVLDDPASDYALRVRLIDKAEESIDIVMYHQQVDTEIGRPILEALRRAALRDVPVRMIRSFFASVHADPDGLAPFLLNDDGLTTRPELITYGRWLTSPIPGPHSRMWNTFDEKFMVVDGKRVVTGGRGQGADYLHWKDLDLYLEGPVAQGFKQVFEMCWETAHGDFESTLRDPSNPAARTALQARDRSPELSPALAAKMAEADRLRRSEGYRPESATLYYHPLLRILHQNPRLDFDRIQDAILNRFMEHARTSSRILFYSLYPAQDPRLTAALEAAARRGARVELITNSLESSRNLDSTVWPYDAGIPSQLQLARAGVKIHQWVPSDRYRFLHQKMAVFDGHVLHGSHNFNWSSTHSYDELELDLEDQGLADELASRFERDAAEHTRLMSVAELESQSIRYATGILVSDWFLGFY